MLLALIAEAAACGPFLGDCLLSSPESTFESMVDAPVADFGVELLKIAPEVPFRYVPGRAPLPGGGADAAEYERAAALYRQGLSGLATPIWDALIEKPGLDPAVAVRTAYMLGRLRSDPARFQQVRRLAQEGAPDPEGLAAASYGEEARIHMDSGRPEMAVPLYVAQLATGDPSALSSLKHFAVPALLELPPERWVRDPVVQDVVVSWYCGYGDAELGAGAWMEASRAAGSWPSHPERVAWVLYRAGDVGAAEEWLQKAAPNNPLRKWIAAKIALRAGRLEEAESLLEGVPPGFNAEEEWSWGWFSHDWDGEGVKPREEAWRELGVLRLSAGRFLAAFDAFRNAGATYELAYVADRVLTLGELEGVVGEDPWLRTLYFRRLVREGRWDAAQAAAPSPELADAVGRVAQGIEVGDAVWARRGARAQGLWSAAVVMREMGMELAGTELAPDFAVNGGNYQFPFIDRGPGPLGAGPEEQARLAASAATPDARYHYRYTAAALAGRAADLLPADDDRTIALYCQAGSWLKILDPQAADLYYKLMVTRGWNHPLAQEADRLRWFPAECPEPFSTRELPPESFFFRLFGG